MGTGIDSTVRFGGTNKAKIGKALNYIFKIQEETEEISGNGVCDYSNEPNAEENGNYVWSAYHKSGDVRIEKVLRDQLLPLTQDGDFEFWIYWECMDGYYQCSLENYQNGEQRYEHLWDGLVAGIDLATAIANFEEQPQAGQLKVLIDAVASQSCSEWSEDKPDNLKSTTNMAALVYEFLERHPELIHHALLQKSIIEMHASLQEVLQGIDEYDLWDELFEPNGETLRALSALTESAMLRANSAELASSSTKANDPIRL